MGKTVAALPERTAYEGHEGYEPVGGDEVDLSHVSSGPEPFQVPGAEASPSFIEDPKEWGRQIVLGCATVGKQLQKGETQAAFDTALSGIRRNPRSSAVAGLLLIALIFLLVGRSKSHLPATDYGEIAAHAPGADWNLEQAQQVSEQKAIQDEERSRQQNAIGRRAVRAPSSYEAMRYNGLAGETPAEQVAEAKAINDPDEWKNMFDVFNHETAKGADGHSADADRAYAGAVAARAKAQAKPVSGHFINRYPRALRHQENEEDDEDEMSDDEVADQQTTVGEPLGRRQCRVLGIEVPCSEGYMEAENEVDRDQHELENEEISAIKHHSHKRYPTGTKALLKRLKMAQAKLRRYTHHRSIFG